MLSFKTIQECAPCPVRVFNKIIDIDKRDKFIALHVIAVLEEILQNRMGEATIHYKFTEKNVLVKTIEDIDNFRDTIELS